MRAFAKALILSLVVILIVISGLSSQAAATSPQCPTGEIERSHSIRSDSLVCVTSGYCTAYDYNPASGRDEFYYGYHSKCDGEMTRSIHDLVCEVPGGVIHSVHFEGPYGDCRVL